jgi:hypothetical protein
MKERLMKCSMGGDLTNFQQCTESKSERTPRE